MVGLPSKGVQRKDASCRRNCETLTLQIVKKKFLTNRQECGIIKKNERGNNNDDYPH